MDIDIFIEMCYNAFEEKMNKMVLYSERKYTTH